MTASNTNYYHVGKIVNTHGVNGEVRVMATTDFPDERFALGSELRAVKKNGETEMLEIRGHRLHKQFHLLIFKGYESRTVAEKLKEASLEVHESMRETLHENEFYYSEIIGMDVYTYEGEALGTIREILTPGANDVWVVRRHGHAKDLLLPYISEVVQSVDVENQLVTVHLLEGLLDE
ncbi:16S rRNA processing protein RimM [Geomicrobium halophilum]|uniref:Ribosome maturation factor RimM n=1 Tax=Geomicrobium halophilum TaxID=549000 RepID=A0A841PSP2_9BACL|nr:ribosome maturation factor RimM [Geomicrobium halophilum]MBB6449321.1 16S rRNA processing protein RimM [Geomicrobium halophilum]